MKTKSVKDVTEQPQARPGVACSDWFGTWELEANKPATYFSVLVYGVLECEDKPDTHEGYWDGRKWQSVRRDDDISKVRKLKLLNVTHWTPRPTGPNDPSSAA